MNVSEVMVRYLNTDIARRLRKANKPVLLAARRPKDRPLVVGARIDPAQYTRQFCVQGTPVRQTLDGLR